MGRVGIYKHTRQHRVPGERERDPRTRAKLAVVTEMVLR